MSGLREAAAAVGFFGVCAIGAAASIWTASMLVDGIALTVAVSVAIPAAIAGYIAAARRGA